MPARDGKRKKRDQIANRRIPKLGYYSIITDTKETEHNYMIGLRDSIPSELRGQLVIKVCKTDTTELVNEAMKVASSLAQYSEPWILFDRDQVKDFDKIVSEAQRKGIKVGWSNPCIEVWFSAYLGQMPSFVDSVSCCRGFAHKFKNLTGQEYEKSDRLIYQKLCRYGDESRAIEIAQKKLEDHLRKNVLNPSEMYPCTTVHLLVDEIIGKIKH